MKKIAKKKVVKKKIVRKPAKRPVKKALKKPAKVRVPKKPVSRKPVKKAAKKQAKKTAAKKKPVIAMEGTFVGEITHYFPQVSAAVVKLQIPLAVGDTLKVKGHTTDFTQQLTSLQINRAPVQAAKVGDEIGFQVKSRVRRGDIVTRL